MINDHPIIKGHNKNLEAIHTALKRPKLNDQINHNKPVLFKTCITQTYYITFCSFSMGCHSLCLDTCLKFAFYEMLVVC